MNGHFTLSTGKHFLTETLWNQTGRRAYGLVLALLGAMFAMSVPALGDIMLTKLATDDPVVATVSADLTYGGRNNYVLTNKKIIALDHNGDVNAELTGLQRARAIAATGYQIYVVGSTGAGDDMYLRKYRFDPSKRKIEFVSQSTEKVHLDPTPVEVVIVGNEVWVVSSVNAAGWKWAIRQYYTGSDEELLKKRNPRTPAINNDWTDLWQVHGTLGSNLFQHRMTVDPFEPGIVYFAGASNTSNGIPLSRIKVTNTELSREALVSDLHPHAGRQALDLRATDSGVYLYAHDGGATTYLYRVDRKTLGNRRTAFIRGRPEKVIDFGSLAFSRGAIYAVTRIQNLNIAFFNASGQQDGPDKAGATAFNYAVGKIDLDLNRWDQTGIFPQGGGATAPEFGLPFLMDGGSSVLLVGSITNGGTAIFANDKELMGKASFAAPLSLGDLSLRDRSYELTVRAEIKDPANAGATLALHLPSSDVSPGLGVNFYRAGDRITVKMPEHAYSYGINNFLRLQGLTKEQIDEKIRDPALNSRLTPIGYTVTRVGDPQTVTGEGASVTVEMTRSTNVTFHFKRDWALTIDSVVGELPGFAPGSGQALGNPEPVAGKHWIEENTVIAPLVDGIVTSATEPGTRYINRAYVLNGGNERSWGSLEQRLQAPRFTMTGPAHYAYLWRAQHSVTVSTSTTKSAGLPAIEGSGRVDNGSGVFWFNRGNSIKVGASDQSGEAMRGVLNAGGALADINGWSRAQFPGGESFAANGKTYRAKLILSLTQAATVSWDYAAPIFRQAVAIGDSVSLAGAGSELFPSDERLTPAIAARIDAARAPSVTSVIEAPPGSDPGSMMIWSPFERKVYPLRPGRFLVEWPVNDGGTPLLTEITSRFPGDIVRHPAVVLANDSNSGDIARGATFIPLKNTIAGQPNTVAAESDHLDALHAPARAFDGDPNSKFLMKAGLGSTGIVIAATRSAVPATLEFVTGDDAFDRDPLTYTLEGANAMAGPWTLISSGPTGIANDTGRRVTTPRIALPGTVAFTHFRLLFPTVRNASSAMQIAEVRLVGSEVRQLSITRHYRALLHESMPAVDLDRSGTDDIAFKQLAYSATLDGAAGTNLPPANITTPAVLPVVANGKLTFPVEAATLAAAEGKHVLVLTK
ncbi:MAG: hypothetical protein V4710_18515, partial [Verrucomicrobiota bacterium]